MKPGKTRAMIAGAVLAALIPAAALAKDQVVTVDSQAGPWVAGLNKKMPFGVGDAKPPVVVTGFAPDRDEKLAIIPEGTTSTPGHATIDAGGIADQQVDDTFGPHKKRYPSFYTPKILYPANAHALVGVFIDAKGVVLGRPFVIGSGVRVPVADGAAGLALGFNDESAAGNGGALKVTVQMPDD
jgi:hypothetical protein